jgi:hypothetical protein
MCGHAFCYRKVRHKYQWGTTTKLVKFGKFGDVGKFREICEYGKEPCKILQHSRTTYFSVFNAVVHAIKWLMQWFCLL